MRDHNPCNVKLIFNFCLDAFLYLISNPQGVVAVHCKAGKGRTGLMICSLLLFLNSHLSAEEAIHLFDKRRTKDCKGLTIASQRRYVKYFENFLRKLVKKPYILNIGRFIKEGKPEIKETFKKIEKPLRLMSMLVGWLVNLLRRTLQGSNDG